MRFSAVHKTASYLMLASAFAAVALSGEIALPWVAATAICGALSWLVEPARSRLLRSRGWARAWTLSTVALLAWTVAEVMRGEPPIVSGVRFLCFFLVNKLWNRRTSKDWQQAYVLSFLLLVAGTTLNTDLAYALCFLGYVVFATWTLTLFHLRREMEENYLLKHSDDAAQSERVEVDRILNSRRVVGASFLAGTSLVSLGIFVASTAIFFLFPRVGFGVFFHPSRGGLRMGFNDSGVELGQNGLIKDNDQVVMRVVFPGGKHDEALHFRGIAFERYERGKGGRTAGWSPASSAATRRDLHRVDGVSLVRSVPPDRAKVRARLARALQQEIYLEPMGETSALLLASAPLAIQLPSSRIGPSPPSEGDPLDDLFATGRTSGIRYTAWSELDPPPTALLERQEELTADEAPAFASSLQLPSDLPPRISALARSIVRDAGARGPYAKAMAIQRYLARYQYTTRLERDFRYDPLEDFLFVHRRGHCEYFATALAILLRAVGVPTRHVAGFYGGAWNGYGGYLQVRQRDAHAWVEVWIGDGGWVTFDPTPPGAALAEEPAFGERFRQLLDVVQLAWFKYVVEYDLGKQVDLLQRARRWWGEGSGATVKSGGSPFEWIGAHRRPLVAGAVALLAIAWLWRRRRLDRRARPAPHRASASSLRALERALRAVAKRGTMRAVAETPAELATRAAAAGDPGAAPLAELVALYYQARFGGARIDPRQLDALAARVVRPPAGVRTVAE